MDTVSSEFRFGGTVCLLRLTLPDQRNKIIRRYHRKEQGKHSRNSFMKNTATGDMKNTATDGMKNTETEGMKNTATGDMKNTATDGMTDGKATRKEPNIYSLIIVTWIAAAVFVVMLYLNVGAATLGAFYLGYLSVMLVLLICYTVRQVRCNPYSYNIIYYRGFILFFLVLLLTSIRYLMGIFRVPYAFSAYDIIWFIMDSAITYLFMSASAIVVFSVWLCISNICLIRHEGKRFVNILGILLAFLMTGGLMILIWFTIKPPIEFPPNLRFFISLILNLGAVFYLYFECMLIGALIAVVSVSHYQPDPDKDFIIILGCKVRKDGTPTPLLRGRIDRAIGFCEMQKEETGHAPYFVTSGGQGPDEVTSESASMKAYLLEQGIPEEQIIEEDRSGNTYQNMLFSKEKILAVKPDAKVAYSTTNYHVFRSGLYARRVGMPAMGMGQPTRWWFWANATVREFIGLLTDNKRVQALILGSFTAICVGITWLSFR